MIDHVIDFHMLTHPTQVRDATGIIQRLSNSPVAKLHVLPGVDGNIGAGRSEGFKQGTSEYVSFVDDDDDVIIDCLPSCIHALENNDIDAVATKEYIDYKGNRNLSFFPEDLAEDNIFTLKQARYIHHLVIFKRTSIVPYLDRLACWSGWPEIGLIASMILDGAKFMAIHEPGYVWMPDREKGAHRIPKCDEVRQLALQTI